MRRSTVPSSPHGRSAASSIAASSIVVVVLPFVPVTPATSSSPLGWPQSASASSAMPSRASSQTICGTRETGQLALDEQRDRAVGDRGGSMLVAVGARPPRSAQNSEPGPQRSER